jgi:hypothetical protein
MLQITAVSHLYWLVHSQIAIHTQHCLCRSVICEHAQRKMPSWQQTGHCLRIALSRIFSDTSAEAECCSLQSGAPRSTTQRQQIEHISATLPRASSRSTPHEEKILGPVLAGPLDGVLKAEERRPSNCSTQQQSCVRAQHIRVHAQKGPQSPIKPGSEYARFCVSQARKCRWAASPLQHNSALVGTLVRCLNLLKVYLRKQR